MVDVVTPMPPLPQGDKFLGLKKPAEMLLQVMQDASDEGKHDIVVDAVRAFQQKRGVQTTEFYIAGIMLAAGGLMQWWPGHETIGGLLSTVGGGLYILSRMVVKVAQAK